MCASEGKTWARLALTIGGAPVGRAVLLGVCVRVCACVCMRVLACVCVCVCVCARARARARVRACVCEGKTSARLALTIGRAMLRAAPTLCACV